MPSEKHCDIARQITGSRASDIEINIQCSNINSADKFILSNSIEKMLKTHGLPIEEGWKMHKKDFESIALEFLVDPAVAYCLYKDWKRWHTERALEEA